MDARKKRVSAGFILSEVEFSRILVRATNWVGDAVMSIPALQRLRLHHPNARISILARPWVAGLYGRESFCDELIPYTAPAGWGGMRQKQQLASTLRARGFDCAILFQNAFEAAALVWMAGVPTRIGYDRDMRRFLLTQAVRPPEDGEIPRHQRFYYLELLRRAGLISQYPLDESIRLDGAAQARSAGSILLRRAGVQLPVVAVTPGAAYGGAKRWLPDRFAEVALTLAQRLGGAIAIFGSKEERRICAAVAGAVTGKMDAAAIPVRNFAGETTLSELIDMLAACHILVTNDSGPMHIASALGIPTVAIFGATDDTATGPTGEHARVVRVPVECSPCLLRECPIDHRCMAAVTAEMTAQASLVLLEGSGDNEGDRGHTKQDCHDRRCLPSA